MESSVENLLGETIFSEKNACTEISLEFLKETIRRYQEKYPQLALVMMGLPGVEVDGAISFAFDRSNYIPQGDTVRQVAEKIVGFVRFWNPHRLVLYHEKITSAMELELRKACAAFIPERFLPKLILGRPLREDYRRGIRALAGRYLGKLDKTEEYYA